VKRIRAQRGSGTQTAIPFANEEEERGKTKKNNFKFQSKIQNPSQED
jgi:hypothetical protein